MTLNRLCYWVVPFLFLACSSSAPSPTHTTPVVSGEPPVDTSLVRKTDDLEIIWRHFNGLSLLEAKMNRKIAVLTFTDKNCGPCRHMKATTFKTHSIISMLNEKFVPIILDGADYLPVMEKLEIDKVWPTTVFLNSDGSMITSISGYIAPEVYAKFLKTIVDAQANQAEERPEPSLTHSAGKD